MSEDSEELFRFRIKLPLGLPHTVVSRCHVTEQFLQSHAQVVVLGLTQLKIESEPTVSAVTVLVVLLQRAEELCFELAEKNMSFAQLK